MKLQLRLILSYVLITGLYLTLVGVLFPFFSGLGPSIGGEPRPLWMEFNDFRADSRIALEKGGIAAVTDEIERHPLPPEDGILILGDKGQTIYQRGQVSTPDPELVRQARGDRSVLDWTQARHWSGYFKLGDNNVGIFQYSIHGPGPVDEGGLRRRTDEGLVRARVVGGLVCLCLGVALSALIARPVKRLVGAVQQLGAGNLDLQVPEQGPGELLELARSFNSMGARVRDSLEGLRQEKARVERMEASRRDFLADVSHNLGTPLAAALGWVNALRDGIVRDPKEQELLLSKVRRDLLYVARMVRQLLDLSRWESRGPELRWESFPLVDPLMEAVETQEEAARVNEIGLKFDGLESGLLVKADRLRVRELFQIFLENAVHHAGRGCQLTIAVRSQGDRVEVVIRDDGRGIPAEKLPHLKERYQGSSGRGSGLGLAIAERLLTSHGSELYLESEEGEGTTIRFSLPRGEISTN